MEFGCCGNLVASGPDKTGIEIIEKITEYGYDYIELPLAEMSDLGEGEFEQLKDRIQDSGIPCRVCNNLFPASIRLTGPDVNMKQIEQYLGYALARAEFLGVDTVVFGSGGAKNVPDGFSHETAFKQVVEITKLLAVMAEKHELTIVIEPIRKPECNIINTFFEGVMLAKEVNHKNIKVLVDYYHMVWEEESPEHILKYGKEYLHHIHLANPNLATQESREAGRVYPSSTDEWDYSDFIRALKDIGYDRRISIEAGAFDFDCQARKALDFLQKNFK